MYQNGLTFRESEYIGTQISYYQAEERQRSPRMLRSAAWPWNAYDWGVQGLASIE
ncbi:MAG: hypothetical protein ACLTF6_07770 [Clostridium sp.]